MLQASSLANAIRCCSVSYQKRLAQHPKSPVKKSSERGASGAERDSLSTPRTNDSNNTPLVQIS